MLPFCHTIQRAAFDSVDPTLCLTAHASCKLHFQSQAFKTGQMSPDPSPHTIERSLHSSRKHQCLRQTLLLAIVACGSPSIQNDMIKRIYLSTPIIDEEVRMTKKKRSHALCTTVFPIDVVLEVFCLFPLFWLFKKNMPYAPLFNDYSPKNRSKVILWILLQISCNHQ